MYENDIWSGLADFLANMIEKYAGQMELDTLPDPRRQSRLLAIEEMYRKYMRLSAQARQEQFVCMIQSLIKNMCSGYMTLSSDFAMLR